MPSSKFADPRCLEYLGGAGGWQKEVHTGGGEGLNWEKEERWSLHACTSMAPLLGTVLQTLSQVNIHSALGA